MFRAFDGDWTVRHLSGPLPGEAAAVSRGIAATVPGVVHLDLIAAGLIEDPHVGDAESRLHWIGDSDWEYHLSFEWSPDGEVRHDLVADGLDTVATIVLNGVTVADTANQHRSYRFEVGHALREGTNELSIGFASPTRYAREQEQLLGARPHAYTHPFNAIRKAACSFGWDWGIDTPGCGIWRRIGLDAWSGVRIATVRPIVHTDSGRRDIDVHVDLEWDGATATATVTAAAAGVEQHADAEARQGGVVVPLAGCTAELWWPRTHGAQPLYELTVTAGASGAGADVWRGRVGFRSVDIDLAPDEVGSPFTIRVNDEPIYVRGANWIPDDLFLPRITKESLRTSIRDAMDAGMNLLRVWGGGIYESEEFYEVCDEAGILVWQDFTLACAAYAEEEPLWQEFEAEARQAVARLASHPSLALWNGGNENIWGYVDWNWRTGLDGRTWGEGYYTELFPAIVAELAPGTPYVEGSPFSFSRYVHPNDPRHGTMHIWDVWNQVDYSEYRRYRPRFVSEFGFQAPPAWSTLEYAVHDEPMHPFGPHMLVHQKADDGNGKLRRGLGAHLPYPDDIDAWHWAMQLNQARAVSFGIEWFRSLFPENSGAIVWQLNDIWPAISWAAVDHFGHRKPLWYALRRAYADRLITIQPSDEGVLELVVHNDAPAAFHAELRLERARFDGTVLASSALGASVDARALDRWRIPEPVAVSDDPATEYIAVRDGGRTLAFAYFAEDPQLTLRDDITTTSRGDDDGYSVTVRAGTLTKDITILADKVHPDAVVDDALVTLSAGDSHVFRVRAPSGIDPERFTDRAVLRSANEFGAR